MPRRKICDDPDLLERRGWDLQSALVGNKQVYDRLQCCLFPGKVETNCQALESRRDLEILEDKRNLDINREAFQSLQKTTYPEQDKYERCRETRYG